MFRSRCGDKRLTVDGALPEDRASTIHFHPEDSGDKSDEDDQRLNPTSDFRGRHRTNDDPASATDQNARLYG